MSFWRKSAAAQKPAPQAAKSVLVIKLGGLADFVQALAAAKLIRDFHVGARITLLTTEEMRVFAKECPYFDVVEADGKPKEPQQTAQLIARIRGAKYDMVYDLESSRLTSTYYQGLRPWPPNWSGAVNNCSHPYPDAARTLHPLDRLAVQLEAAGVTHGEPVLPDVTWVRVALRDPPRISPDYFGIRGRYVLLLPKGPAPGTPPNAPPSAKCWPEQKYVELAQRVAANGVTPVVIGTADERDIGAAIARAEPKAKNLITRADLFQVSALAERAAFALGEDVDLMHVAAAAGVSCLIFQPSASDTERAAPRGRGGVVAITASNIADIPVDQVERQLRNCGVYQGIRATA